jgi:hypothetical protein
LIERFGRREIAARHVDIVRQIVPLWLAAQRANRATSGTQLHNDFPPDIASRASDENR